MPAPRPIGGSTLTHKLGRRPATPEMRAKVLPLRRFVCISAARPIPDTDDYAAKAQPVLRTMQNNNREGCCVASMLAKQIGAINAYRPGGTVLVPTDAETSRFYHEVGGPGDNGLYMPDAYTYAVKTGFQIGGVRHKIDGFAAFDSSDDAITNAAFHWFVDGVGLGVNLTERQYANFSTGTLWTNDGSRVIGGHAIPLTMRGPDRFRLATWAEQPDVTREAVRDRNWADESYVMISKEAIDASGRDTNGVNWDALSAAMEAIRNGGTPDIPDDPNPPTPPTPPTPGEWDWELKRTYNLLLATVGVDLGIKWGWNASTRAGVDWWKLAGDVFALVLAFRKQDWPGVISAAEAVLADLGILLSLYQREQLLGALRIRHELAPLGKPTQPPLTGK